LGKDRESLGKGEGRVKLNLYSTIEQFQSFFEIPLRILEIKSILNRAFF